MDVDIVSECHSDCVTAVGERLKLFSMKSYLSLKTRKDFRISPSPISVLSPHLCV